MDTDSMYMALSEDCIGDVVREEMKTEYFGTYLKEDVEASGKANFYPQANIMTEPQDYSMQSSTVSKWQCWLVNVIMQKMRRRNQNCKGVSKKTNQMN